MFAVHDVTTPLPVLGADLLYARLVLAHLPDPLAVVAEWRSQLATEGLVVIEDLEVIDAPPGPLRDYDALSAAVVRSGGGPMYAGRALAQLGGRLVEVKVDAAVAARIYRVNVAAWRRDPAVDDEDLGTLAAGLDALVSGAPSPPVTWVVRQLVLGAADR
jgi:hypothetical protein